MSQSGWVYFAQDGDRTKIGWTSVGVDRRLRDLRTAAPDIELVHVIYTTDKGLEKELHKLFKDYRIAREWFGLPEDWRLMLPEQYRERGSRLLQAGIGAWDARSLVGSWFHSFKGKRDEDGLPEFHWQGCVVADLGGGFVLVQLFSWGDGLPTLQRVVSVASMTDWDFYDTDEKMRDAWGGSAQVFNDNAAREARLESIRAGRKKEKNRGEDRYSWRVMNVAEIVAEGNLSDG